MLAPHHDLRSQWFFGGVVVGIGEKKDILCCLIIYISYSSLGSCSDLPRAREL